MKCSGTNLLPLLYYAVNKLVAKFNCQTRDLQFTVYCLLFSIYFVNSKQYIVNRKFNVLLPSLTVNQKGPYWNP